MYSAKGKERPQMANNKERTKLQKVSMNAKIIIFLVLFVLVAFFVAYMISTTLDDVIDNEKNGQSLSSGDQTTVYEINEPSEVQ